MSRRFVLALAAFSASCAGTLRVYPTPLTPGEGEMLAPALIASAQQQGLRAWRGINGEGAIVELTDGSYLGWQRSMDGRDFQLDITLPGGIPEPEVGPRFDAAKVRADAIWAAAIEARRQNVVAPVIYSSAPPPPPPSGPGASFSVSVPGVQLNVNAPAPEGGDCRYGSDGIRVCGYNCQLGSNGHAYCAATPDGSCRLNSDGTFSCGRDCQLSPGGRFVCQ